MTGPVRVVSMNMTPERVRVGRAAAALHRDGASPAGAFELLEAIVRDQTWKLVEYQGKRFETFTEFVKAPDGFGLGTTVEELKKVVALRHPQEDTPAWRERAEKLRREVKELLDGEILPSAEPGVNQYQQENVARSPVGKPDTRVKVIARLKRDDPELAARVMRGEVAANAAARQKGWRKPRIVLTSPGSVAAALRKHMSLEDLARLIELLKETP